TNGTTPHSTMAGEYNNTATPKATEPLSNTPTQLALRYEEAYRIKLYVTSIATNTPLSDATFTAKPTLNIGKNSIVRYDFEPYRSYLETNCPSFTERYVIKNHKKIDDHTGCATCHPSTALPQTEGETIDSNPEQGTRLRYNTATIERVAATITAPRRECRLTSNIEFSTIIKVRFIPQK
ncbi:MAG: hypothetical protein SNI57_03290, partial [Rikenellaceae bacterium]